MKSPSPLDYITSFLQDEKSFLKDSTVIISGKVFIAMLAFAITPILTRLYSPAAYGEFALFNSVIQNLVILGTLALPTALSTAKKEDLKHMLGLTLVVISIFTVGITSIMFYIPKFLSISTNVINEYWYLVPIGFMITSVTISLNSLHLRLKHFNWTTKVNVAESLAVKGLNLMNGWLKLGGLGLILSDILAKILNAFLLAIRLPQYYVPNKKISWPALKTMFIKTNQYPLFVMPAQWVSILSTQLIIWFIIIEFTTQDLGKFTIALSLINIPLYILSNTFQPVITQRFVSAKYSNIEVKMNRLVGFLFSISTLVFGVLFIIPSNWFVYFLGDQWEGIGTIIKILCCWNLVLFIDQSINNCFHVFERHRQKLYINLADLAMQVLLLAFAPIFTNNLNLVIVFFVFAKVLASLIRIAYLRQIVSSITQA